MERINCHYQDELIFHEPVVGIIGQFDGLHIGHMKLIDAAKQKASELKMKTALITFNPHPDFVLKKRENFGYLTPIEEKERLIPQIGIDIIVVIQFTLE